MTNGITINFTIKLGWSIIYIEGSKIIISKNTAFLSLKIDYVLANTVNPNEMLIHAGFHLDIHCLPLYWFRGFQYTKY